MRYYDGYKRQFDMRDIRVIQVGNIVDDTDIGFKNPQRGRVYSIDGIAPAVYCYGGGNLEPKIIVYEWDSAETAFQYLRWPVQYLFRR